MEAGNLALRACPEAQVALTLDPWKQLGVTTVPASFASVDLDQDWKVRPAVIALSEDLREPFMPCEVEVTWAGDAEAFWTSFDGLDEEAAIPVPAADVGSDLSDASSDNSYTKGAGVATSDDGSDVDLIAEDENLQPPEQSDVPKRRTQTPAWRKRTERAIGKVVVKQIEAGAAIVSGGDLGYSSASEAERDTTGGGGASDLASAGAAAAPSRPTSPKDI